MISGSNKVPLSVNATSLTEHNTRVPITASIELSSTFKASPTYKIEKTYGQIPTGRDKARKGMNRKRFPNV